MKLAEDNEKMRVLSCREEQIYLASASPPLRDVATLMLETGMRPEEVYRIDRNKVCLDDGYLFNPFGKTKAATRRIGLTRRAAEVLRNRMQAQSGKYLFPHQKNRDQPMLKVNNAHTGALSRSGVEAFRLYDLAHLGDKGGHVRH